MSASTFTFNFEAAVAEARRDYPMETQNLSFVDLSAPTAWQQVYDWQYDDLLRAMCHSLYPVRATFENTKGLPYPNPDTAGRAALETFFAENLFHLQGMARQNTQRAFGKSAGACFGSNSGDGRKMIVMDTMMQQTRMLDDRDKDLYFVFSHELGHAVVPGAALQAQKPSLEKTVMPRLPENTHAVNTHEVTADSFGLLRGLSKGILTLQDVESVTSARMWAATIGDVSHFTSPQLQILRIKAQDANFISLTPAQVSAIAESHAARYPMPADGIAALEQECKEFLRRLIDNLRKDNGRVSLMESAPDGMNVIQRLQSDSFFRTEVAQFFNDVCARSEKGGYVHAAARQIAKLAQDSQHQGPTIELTALPPKR